MVASSTQIANLALARIGQERIENIASDDSAAARWANTFYGIARDYVTELTLWRHAKRTATLAETTNTRENDYDYAYTRPSDCLSFRYVLPAYGAFNPQDPIRFESEGEVIFTSEYQARGVYVVQETDVTKFPPSFTDAVAWYLAHLLVTPLRQSADFLQLTTQGFERAVSAAIARGEAEQLWILSADEAQPDWLRGR